MVEDILTLGLKVDAANANRSVSTFEKTLIRLTQRAREAQSQLSRLGTLKLNYTQALQGAKQLEQAFKNIATAQSKLQKNFTITQKVVNTAHTSQGKLASSFRGTAVAAGGAAAAVGAMGGAAKHTVIGFGSLEKGVVGSVLGFRRMYLAAAALTATFGVLTKSLYNSIAGIESIRMSLNAAAGDAEKGGAEFEWLREESKRLGLNLMETAQQFKLFSAATKGTSLEGDRARAIFTSFSEAVTVMGLSADDATGVFRALQQMVSKGSVNAEELRQQLGERMPAAFQLAADAMGVTTKELNDMLKRGEVLAEDMLPKLALKIREAYGDDVTNAVKTLRAESNRLATAWTELGEAAGKAGLYDLFRTGIVGAREAMEGIVVYLNTEFQADWDAFWAGLEIDATVFGWMVEDSLGVFKDHWLGGLDDLKHFLYGAWLSVFRDPWEEAFEDASLTDILYVFFKADLPAMIEIGRTNFLEGWDSIWTDAKILLQEFVIWVQEKLQGLLQTLGEKLWSVGSDLEENGFFDWAKGIGKGLATIGQELRNVDFIKDNEEAIEDLKTAHKGYVDQLNKERETIYRVANEMRQEAEERLKIIQVQRAMIKDKQELAKWQAREEEARKRLDAALLAEAAAQHDLNEEMGTGNELSEEAAKNAKKLADAYESLREELDPLYKLNKEFTEDVITLQKYLAAHPDKLAEVRDLMAKLAIEYEKNVTELSKTDTMKAFEEAWVGALERIDEAFADVWKGAFSSFKDFADALKDAFKQLLGELLHLAITRPIIISIAGALGVDMATGGLTQGGLLSNVAGGFTNSILGGISNLFGSGIAGIGSLIGGQFGAGVNLMGNALATQGIAGVGNFLTGGFGSLTTTAQIGAIASILAPIVIGAMLAANLFNKAKPTVGVVNVSDPDQFAATQGGWEWGNLFTTTPFGSVGFADTTTFNMTDEWREAMVGFLENIRVIDEAIATYLTPAEVTGIKDALNGFFEKVRDKELSEEQILGIFIDRYSEIFAGIDSALAAALESERGNITNENFAATISGLMAIWNAFTEDLGIFAEAGEELGSLQSAIDWMKSMAKAGEDLGTTFARLTLEWEAVSQAVTVLGVAFSATGTAAVEAASALVEAAGGLEAFTQKVQFVFENFYSDTERAFSALETAGAAIIQFNKQLGVTGSNLIDTKDEWRDFVAGLDLATEEGQRLFAIALDLAPAIVAMDNAVDSILQTLRAIDQLADSITERISSEIAALSGVGANPQTFAAAGWQAWGALQQTPSTADPEEVAQQINELLDYIGQWYDAKAAQIEAFYDAQKAAIDAQIAALQTQKSLIQENIQIQITALQEQLALANQWASILSSAQQLLDRMMYEQDSPASTAARLSLLQTDIADLQSQFATATGEDRLDIAERLLSLYSRQLDLSQEVFQRPSPEYMAAYNEIAYEVTQLRDEAAAKADEAEDIQREIKNLQNLQTEQLASIDRQIQALRNQQAALDAAQAAQLEALRREAIGYYQQVQAWSDAFFAQAKEEAVTQLSEMIKQSDIQISQLQQLQEIAAILGAKVIDGSYASGLSYVPYDGFVAQLHRGERILTAAEARQTDMPYTEGPTEVSFPMHLTVSQDVSDQTVNRIMTRWREEANQFFDQKMSRYFRSRKAAVEIRRAGA